MSDLFTSFSNGDSCWASGFPAIDWQGSSRRLSSSASDIIDHCSGDTDWCGAADHNAAQSCWAEMDGYMDVNPHQAQFNMLGTVTGIGLALASGGMSIPAQFAINAAIGVGMQYGNDAFDQLAGPGMSDFGRCAMEQSNADRSFTMCAQCSLYRDLSDQISQLESRVDLLETKLFEHQYKPKRLSAQIQHLADVRILLECRAVLTMDWTRPLPAEWGLKCTTGSFNECARSLCPMLAKMGDFELGDDKRLTPKAGSKVCMRLEARDDSLGTKDAFRIHFHNDDSSAEGVEARPSFPTEASLNQMHDWLTHTDRDGPYAAMTQLLSIPTRVAYDQILDEVPVVLEAGLKLIMQVAQTTTALATYIMAEVGSAPHGGGRIRFPANRGSLYRREYMGGSYPASSTSEWLSAYASDMGLSYPSIDGATAGSSSTSAFCDDEPLQLYSAKWSGWDYKPAVRFSEDATKSSRSHMELARLYLYQTVLHLATHHDTSLVRVNEVEILEKWSGRKGISTDGCTGGPACEGLFVEDHWHETLATRSMFVPAEIKRCSQVTRGLCSSSTASDVNAPSSSAAFTSTEITYDAADPSKKQPSGTNPTTEYEDWSGWSEEGYGWGGHSRTCVEVEASCRDAHNQCRTSGDETCGKIVKHRIRERRATRGPLTGEHAFVGVNGTVPQTVRFKMAGFLSPEIDYAAVVRAVFGDPSSAPPCVEHQGQWKAFVSRLVQRLTDASFDQWFRSSIAASGLMEGAFGSGVITHDEEWSHHGAGSGIASLALADSSPMLKQLAGVGDTPPRPKQGAIVVKGKAEARYWADTYPDVPDAQCVPKSQTAASGIRIATQCCLPSPAADDPLRGCRRKFDPESPHAATGLTNEHCINGQLSYEQPDYTPDYTVLTARTYDQALARCKSIDANLELCGEEQTCGGTGCWLDIALLWTNKECDP